MISYQPIETASHEGCDTPTPPAADEVIMSEVLIVDDERNTRELLVHWLKAEGYGIHEAPDAETALAILAEQQIAVATIDKDMPGQGGVWLVGQIQQSHPAVAMLLASGDDQIPPRVSLSRGIQGYLVKPFKRELIVGAVKDAIAWHTVAAKHRAVSQQAADPIDKWLDDPAGLPPKSE